MGSKAREPVSGGGAIKMAIRICMQLIFALCMWGWVCPAHVSAQTRSPMPGIRKVLFVDSYEANYPWSQGIERGIRQILEPNGVELEIVRLDAKENPSPEALQQAALRALERISRYKPDVIIACDDPAQQYLVVPYLKGGELPVVFCGVGWDASAYGYPAPNVTGMVEMEHVQELVQLFKHDAKGPRTGFLTGDTPSDRELAQLVNERFFDNGLTMYFAKNFAEFKAKFLRAQQEVDMLLLRNYAGIEDWDSNAAKAFLEQNTTIPTGAHLSFMADFVVYTIGKLPEEQGEYAATTALRIMDGLSPADIPLAVNKKIVLVVNLKIAKNAGIVVPFSVLRTATVIGAE